MDANVEGLQEVIDRLPLEDQRELFERMRYAFDKNAKPVRASPTIQHTYVYEALCHALPRDHRLVPMIKMRASLPRGADFDNALTWMDNYVTKSCGNISMTSRLSVTTTAFVCLFRYMTKIRIRNLEGGAKAIPVTAVTMLRHVHWVPAAVEASFPGYAAAGLLDRVATAAAA
jgi:hypothetical protein